jgi:hypothetical protein
MSTNVVRAAMKFIPLWTVFRRALWSVVGIVLSVSSAPAANQTVDITPIQLNSALPYKISLQPYDFGPAALPTLHSYNAAEIDGKWIVFAGRTNGLHSFDTVGVNNVPPQFQNQEVWVIDPVAKQSWHRPLTEASANVTATELRSLTPTNTQFYQKDDRLYVSGGYGLIAGTVNGTWNTLTSVNLPEMMDWVVNDTPMGVNSIRQVFNSQFTVTGGAMFEMNGHTHLVSGQNFSGNYTPGSNGQYVSQVRSFDIFDDGVTLSVSPFTANPTPKDDTKYRRRDLNIVPVIRPDTGSGLGQGLVVFSGVFTSTDGIWTVPVEISDAGAPSMADPANAATFKQGFNGYHSAKLGLFSEATGAMHELLFGGISLQTLDTSTQTVITDNAMPFINDITSIVIDSAGSYSQHWLGEYPMLVDQSGNRLRFGANAEFFLADGIQTYDNGVLKLDALTQPTVLGYIFGGLTSNGPHTRDPNTGAPVPGVISAASNRIFTVMYTPVPEPTSGMLLVCGIGGIGGLAAVRRRRATCSR